MSEWFRNTTWDESIERAFNAKLHRAREKGQYLRLQAGGLTSSHPEVALKLLDRYFALPVAFDHAQAHVERAEAFLTLGRVADAITAYEAALAREVVFPNVLTQAYLHLPYVVATHGIREQYPRALEVLRLYESRLRFPVEHFRWHAARALIAADTQEAGASKVHAENALAAACRGSGLRYHPSVGLVTAEHDGVIKNLEALRSRPTSG